MVYCGICGHPNPDSGSFCTACGSPLVKPEDVTPAPVEEEPVMEEEPVVESEPVDVAPVESEPVAPETDSQSMATPGRISIPLRRKRRREMGKKTGILSVWLAFGLSLTAWAGAWEPEDLNREEALSLMRV